MDRKNQTIIDKKTIEELVQELQYLNSDILPQLRRNGKIYNNISNINDTSKHSFLKLYNISTSLDEFLKRLNDTTDEIANKIDTTSLESKIVERINFDSTTIRIGLKKLNEKLTHALEYSIVNTDELLEHKSSVDKLKKELKYMQIINIFMMIGVALLIYKI